MLMETRASALERAGVWPFVGAWLLACAIMLIAGWQGIARFEFPDPDDSLRLQQVRDWIGGQSWFDVTQYRLNPPDGAPMHWSRLVDLPIAGAILLGRPLFGPHGAELLALVIVPLVTLAAVMALVACLTERLLDRRHALLAALLVPVSVVAVAQLRPMRIDHHGWQIVFAVGAVLAALDTDRRRSGLIAGGAVALWLQVSLEGLPFTAALCALFALRWLIDAAERERLTAFIEALAGGSFLLFLLTRAPSAWFVEHCDSVSAMHLAGMAVAGLGLTALLRRSPESLAARIGALAAIGAVVIAVMAAFAPQCAAGPFVELDPLVRRFWYDQVLEGLPIWRQSFQVAAAVLAFPLVGLIGSWRAFRLAEGQRKTGWAVLLFMLAAATLAAVLVQRAGAVANILALPGGVFLFERALTCARTLRSVPKRLAATSLAFLLVTPAYAVSALDSFAEGLSEKPKMTRVRDCVTRREIGRLDTLPHGIIAAPLDISPSIIVYTGQKAIASGHHRNTGAMRDVIDIFTLPPDEARTLLARRGAGYVAVCPNLAEAKLFVKQGPNGLWAELARGHAPDWLEPVRFSGPSALRVWRVKPAA